ncbi:hypothetical protein BH10PSE13_BH10PSE13_00070 [soil metagenome]
MRAAQRGAAVSAQLALFSVASVAGELQFSEFYDSQLRPAMGQRIGSTELRHAYLEWAAKRGRGALSFREIGRLMAKRGHRKITSDGIKYLDVQFTDGTASAALDPLLGAATTMVLDALAGQHDRERQARLRIIAISQQVDALIEQLQQLRRSIASELDG